MKYSRSNIPDEIALSLEDAFNTNLQLAQPGFQASLQIRWGHLKLWDC